jgi:hypothetical protein
LGPVAGRAFREVSRYRRKLRAALALAAWPEDLAWPMRVAIVFANDFIQRIVNAAIARYEPT